MAETEDLKSFQYRFESDRGHIAIKQSFDSSNFCKCYPAPCTGAGGVLSSEAITGSTGVTFTKLDQAVAPQTESVNLAVTQR